MFIINYKTWGRKQKPEQPIDTSVYIILMLSVEISGSG